MKETLECLRDDVNDLEEKCSRLRKICTYLITKLDVPEAEQKVLASLISKW